ncbi:50S ribosomal protein L18 [Candidatus Shapirobacteria bacterium CG08_land_8_20_14_0_20_39_18]|uniref:Large ribosomal subunit protein uL18 n=1 Tax=Candidatus Shapirobacteria bacterium CG08_land_8_20_14_0_20_39_18 TaxID=1974883 RepID=A0A2M6XED0_9BACT|nr:MAG: 50S ribosomal protein L18 [Candidatus Shapirobacteria bacterium CG08_land_8_20_14_0_20_39_18]PIY66418.1 MAG: 50S ribosomal protein L18 [Candidatus Shapirobacteria bacterium CG_4_10_14_0_8_um_filter_39_15]PJE68390.1 MAG: 50S ribosomal protein L18 [Candidatus Shapirobacteria bacterium CG10_big_fil_rev_8_21_14_0_10_38_8]
MQKEVRKLRTRNKIKAVSNRPRLTVFRSNKFIYGQIIDDNKGITLFSVSDKKENAREAGKLLAQKSLKSQISQVVFDKGPYKYHGVVKLFAEGAREEGLKF